MEETNFNSKSVVLFLGKSINYAIAYMGILLSQQTVVPIGIQAKEREISATLQYCEINMVITDEEHYEVLKNSLKSYKYQLNILLVDTLEVYVLNAKSGMNQGSNQENLDDVVIMLHTSGALSDPKRVMLTHDNLISNVESNIKCLDYSKEEVTLIALPMYFGYCNTAQFLMHVYLGAAMIIMDTIFSPKYSFNWYKNIKSPILPECRLCY